MEFVCATCGAPTNICYTDNGAFGMAHGFCQCKECYLKSGHAECACGALLMDEWKYCPVCGAKQKTT